MNLAELKQAIKDLYVLYEPEGGRWISRDEVLSLIDEAKLADILAVEAALECGEESMTLELQR